MVLWTSANETRKVPPRQEIELATEMRSTETYFHFSRKKSLQSQQAPRPGLLIRTLYKSILMFIYN